MATQAEVQSPQQTWQQLRRSFVGGSEVYELLNIPQYGRGCERALAYRKLGQEPDYPEQEGHEDLFARGHLLEPIVATLYESKTGRKLRRPPLSDEGYPIPKRHPQYPWAGVNTDRIILAGRGGVEETGDLEVKTRAEGPFWRLKRLGAQFGDLLQSQWSNFVTGHHWSSLAELGVFGALPLVWFDWNQDPEVVEIFKRHGDPFAEKVWVKGELPDPPFPSDDQRCRVCSFRLTCRGQEIDRVEARAMRDLRDGKKQFVAIENAELAHTLAEVDLLKAEQKAIEETIEIAKEQALAQLENVEAALVRGYGKVYRLPVQANYFDSKRLKADQPDVYEKYMVHRKTGDYYIRTYPESR